MNRIKGPRMQPSAGADYGPAFDGLARNFHQLFQECEALREIIRTQPGERLTDTFIRLDDRRTDLEVCEARILTSPHPYAWCVEGIAYFDRGGKVQRFAPYFVPSENDDPNVLPVDSEADE